MLIPAYLTAMARRTPPPGAPVVPASTPVVAFGDPRRATVATLGINPSAAEFTGRGQLLADGSRRLATLESLRAQRCDLLTDVQAARVVADCASYFTRRPYLRWFQPLENLLQDCMDASYFDGTACHLDLVQWATDPVWSKIADLRVRQALLDDGVPHLREHLRHGPVRVILLNGRTVVRQAERAGLVSMEVIGCLPLGQTSCTLYEGATGGVRFVGWSANLQGSFGVTAAFRDDLAARIAATVRAGAFAGLAPRRRAI